MTHIPQPHQRGCHPDRRDPDTATAARSYLLLTSMAVILSERGPKRFLQLGGGESKDPQLFLTTFAVPKNWNNFRLDADAPAQPGAPGLAETWDSAASTSPNLRSFRVAGDPLISFMLVILRSIATKNLRLLFVASG